MIFRSKGDKPQFGQRITKFSKSNLTLYLGSINGAFLAVSIISLVT